MLRFHEQTPKYIFEDYSPSSETTGLLAESSPSAFPLFTMEDIYCSSHPGHVLSHFCFDDNILLCDSCMVESSPFSGIDGGNHLAHSVSSKYQIVLKCKQGLHLLTRQIGFFLE